jgi:ribosome maturation factor RimP
VTPGGLAGNVGIVQHQGQELEGVLRGSGVLMQLLAVAIPGSVAGGRTLEQCENLSCILQALLDVFS